MGKLYWIGGSGDWDDITHWSTTSGGANDGALPTIDDNVVFDNNSFPSASPTVSFIGRNAQNVGSIVVETGLTNPPIMHFGAQVTVTANNDGTTTLKGTGDFDFRGALSVDGLSVTTLTGSNTSGTNPVLAITSAASSFNIYAASVTWVMASDLNTTNLVVGSGTPTDNAVLDCSTHAITSTGTVQSTSGGSINFGHSNTHSLTALNTIYGSISYVDATCTISTKTLSFAADQHFPTVDIVADANTTTVLAHNVYFESLSAITDTLSYTGYLHVAGTLNVQPKSASRVSLIGDGTNPNLAVGAFTGQSVAFSGVYSLTALDLSALPGDSGGGSNNGNIIFTTRANRYWIGGSGDFSDIAHWSKTSGGSADIVYLYDYQNAILDNNSFPSPGASVNINVSVLGSLVVDPGIVNQPALTGGANFTINRKNVATGVVDLRGCASVSSASATWTFTGDLNVESLLYLNGFTFSTLLFQSTTGSWKLGTNLNSTNIVVGSSNATDSCVLDFDTFNATVSNNATVNAGGSLHFGHSNQHNIYYIDCTQGSVSYVDATSEIFITSNIAYADGQSFPTLHINPANNNVSFQATLNLENLYVTADSVAFKTLTVSGVTDFQPKNNSRIVASQFLPSTFVFTTGSFSGKSVDFQNVISGNPLDVSALLGGSGDLGGNSNITFTAAATVYWIPGGTTNKWGDSTNWSLSSGGPVTNRCALVQDSAVFDSNSFSTTGLSVHLDVPNVGNTDFSQVTNNPTLVLDTFTNLYGDFKLSSNMGFTPGTNSLTVAVGRTSHIVSGGKQFYTLIAIGTLVFDDATTLTNTLRFSGGTVILNADVTATVLGKTSTGSGVLTFTSNQTLTLKSGLSFPGSSNVFTINPANGLIRFAPASPTILGLPLRNATWPKIELAGASGCTYNFSNSGASIKDISNTVPITQLKFQNGSTYNFEKFSVKGSAGNLITITSDNTSVRTNLNFTGGGVSSCDYLNISHTNATPSNKFYAGINSVDNGDNAGWIFGAAPNRVNTLLLGSNF